MIKIGKLFLNVEQLFLYLIPPCISRKWIWSLYLKGFLEEWDIIKTNIIKVGMYMLIVVIVVIVESFCAMSQKERMTIYMIGDSTMAVAGLAVEGIRELYLP